MNRVVMPRPAAEEDIDDFFFYLALDCANVAAASRFLDALQGAYVGLTENPDIGVVQDFNRSELAGLRVWPIPGFEDRLIYYIPRGDVIDVVRILGGPQDRRTIRHEYSSAA